MRGDAPERCAQGSLPDYEIIIQILCLLCDRTSIPMHHEIINAASLASMISCMHRLRSSLLITAIRTSLRCAALRLRSSWLRRCDPRRCSWFACEHASLMLTTSYQRFHKRCVTRVHETLIAMFASDRCDPHFAALRLRSSRSLMHHHQCGQSSCRRPIDMTHTRLPNLATLRSGSRVLTLLESITILWCITLVAILASSSARSISAAILTSWWCWLDAMHRCKRSWVSRSPISKFVQERSHGYVLPAVRAPHSAWPTTGIIRPQDCVISWS